MVSFWWLLAAFIGGGSAGVLVLALMHAALPEQMAREPEYDQPSRQRE